MKCQCDNFIEHENGDPHAAVQDICHKELSSSTYSEWDTDEPVYMMTLTGELGPLMVCQACIDHLDSEYVEVGPAEFYNLV